ncbi:hypothetical protein FJTKL_04068 [Diaporthe vaccinii]|uniref:Uncharacterized protein n=1 Tax=Diaporthe vaccinii TaxID=105482 RepID=A0ABR4DTV7_9PEZI
MPDKPRHTPLVRALHDHAVLGRWQARHRSRAALVLGVPSLVPFTLLEVVVVVAVGAEYPRLPAANLRREVVRNGQGGEHDFLVLARRDALPAGLPVRLLCDTFGDGGRVEFRRHHHQVVPHDKAFAEIAFECHVPVTETLEVPDGAADGDELLLRFRQLGLLLHGVQLLAVVYRERLLLAHVAHLHRLADGHAHYRGLLLPALYPFWFLALRLCHLVPRRLVSRGSPSLLLLVLLPAVVQSSLPPIYLKRAKASLARSLCNVGLLGSEYSGGGAALRSMEPTLSQPVLEDLGVVLEFCAQVPELVERLDCATDMSSQLYGLAAKSGGYMGD